MILQTLPAAFAATRDAVHAVACYAIAPARKARTDRIGLRSIDGRIGTPPFEDGSQFVLDGDLLARLPGDEIVLTTLRDACAFLGVEPSADPGVGHDLPPFAPDDPLDVDVAASRALGNWYAFGQCVLDDLRARVDAGDVGGVDDVSEAQLWPEHFDLAVTVTLDDGTVVNVGFSPGDRFHDQPYVYVGPHDTSWLEGPFWNAPFGAFVSYGRLVDDHEPVARAMAFIRDGLSAASR